MPSKISASNMRIFSYNDEEEEEEAEDQGIITTGCEFSFPGGSINLVSLCYTWNRHLAEQVGSVGDARQGCSCPG